MADGQRFVTGSGGEVYDEGVEFAPSHVTNELLDSPELDRTPPYDRLVRILEQESHRDYLQPVRTRCGMYLTVLDIQLGFIYAKHLWYIRTGDVDVHQTDSHAPTREAQCEPCCDSGLTHSTLAGEHHYLVLDILIQLGYPQLALHLLVGLLHLRFLFGRGIVPVSLLYRASRVVADGRIRHTTLAA